MSGIKSRRARRMMKQMGLKMEELKDIERVIFQGRQREITIENPAVTVMEVQGQNMYQVAGGMVTEKKIEAKIEISEEDVLLVAQQASVSLERARTVLMDTEGDLAKAILILTAKK